MFKNRKSGILLHPTSLPSAYGIGDFGQAAYIFVDKLAEANQTLWQILPLVPVDGSGSPYASCSAFAGEALLISPELLVKDGLLEESDLSPLPAYERVNYSKAAEAKLPLFEKAFRNFQSSKKPAAYITFCQKNAYWLDDYTLFAAARAYLKAERAAEADDTAFQAFAKDCASLPLTEDALRNYYYGACWNTFPAGLKNQQPAAMKKWKALLADAMEKESFLQYIFHKQWSALKAYANEKGISIIGDAPIFVAYDSADVWANQKLFQLDSKGFPLCVAGVPPDYFSETGQLWGNPLYDWQQHEKTGFVWWTNRIRKALATVDILRLDHFRGFEAYWEIAFGAEDARGGKWVKGPGMAFFRALEKKLGKLPFIAEDLGIITEEVNALREAAGFPGMRVLQFAFGQDRNNAYLPHMYDRNTVVYTGTHDNDTSRGWYEVSSTEAERDHFRRYMNVSGQDASWDLIRLAFSSPAIMAIVPLQDVLHLDTKYRMNIPGTTNANWGFSFSFDWWENGFSDGLKYLSELFGRNQ